MLELFDEFPREVASPTRFFVKSKKEFLEFINKNNGKKRLFTSLYKYDPINAKVNITSIWFDLDSDKSFENIKKIHEWAKQHNYKHIMFFSGGGFHFYILASNGDKLKDPKQALYNCHKHIAEEVGLTIGESETFDIDWHIIGDVRRVVTIPGTYNTRRKKYCICITEEDLEKGLEYIKEKASKPSLHFRYYGKKFFDVSEFDKEIKGYIKPLPYDKDELCEVDKDEALTNLLPCIKVWLSKTWPGWKRRGWIIMWMRKYGLWRKQLDEPFPAMLGETMSLLKQYLQPEEFRHMMREDEKQPYYLYFLNTKNGFPTCDNIKKWGECPLDVKEFCKERKMFSKGGNGNGK